MRGRKERPRSKVRTVLLEEQDFHADNVVMIVGLCELKVLWGAIFQPFHGDARNASDPACIPHVAPTQPPHSSLIGDIPPGKRLCRLRFTSIPTEN